MSVALAGNLDWLRARVQQAMERKAAQQQEEPQDPQQAKAQPAAPGGGSIRVKNRHAYCQVPEAMLGNQLLGHGAVRLGAYLSGRPEGWVVHKENTRRFLHLSQEGWTMAVKQLRQAGYLVTEPRRRPDGRMAGQDYIFDCWPEG